MNIQKKGLNLTGLISKTSVIFLLTFCMLITIESIGQVKYIRKVAYKNGPQKVNVPVFIYKFIAGKGYSQEGVEFYQLDSCDCTKVLKVKFKPKNTDVFQSKELNCLQLTEEVLLTGTGEFVAIRQTSHSGFHSNFEGSYVPDTLITFVKNPAADSALLKILTPIGLTNIIKDKRIIIEAANVANAQASIIDSKRYIFYNPDIIKKINREDWAAIGVFAHELAHHIFFQDITNASDPEKLRELELEADEWAGYMLSYLNAPKDSTLLMANYIHTDYPTATHPGSAERITHIIRGWERGNRTKYNSVIDQRYTGHFSAGRQYYENGNFPKAIEEFTKAIKYNPFFKDAFLYRGISWMRTMSLNEAITNLDTYISSDTTNLEAYQNRSYCYSLLGYPDKALEDVKKSFNINPSEVSNYTLRGIAMYFKGRYNEALKDLNTALKTDSSKINPLFYRGLIKLNLRLNQEAINDFSKVLSKDTTYVPAYYNRAMANLDLGNLESSLSDLNKAVALNPYMDIYIFRRGLVKEQLGMYKDALEDFTILIQMDSAAVINAYYQRGFCFLKLNEFDKAISDYNVALQLNPEFLDAQFSRATTFVTMKKYEQALADYDVLIVKNPIFINYLSRAECYLKTPDYDKAIQDLKKADNLSPNVGRVFLLLASAKMASGNFSNEDVLKDLDKASLLLIDETDKGFCYFLQGSQYKFMGDKVKACQSYNQAKTFNHPEADQALRELKCSRLKNKK